MSFWAASSLCAASAAPFPPGSPWKGLQIRGAAALKPVEQCRHGRAQGVGNLRQIVEAYVFLAAFDLADVRSVEAADVGELLLRPLPGRPQVVDPLAQ
jgi:hypothetical protein